MNLKDIATIAGKSGLYKVVKPARTGVILESLDEQRKKLVTNANYKVSVLKEISIYTTSAEGSVSLGSVLTSIKEKYPQVLETPNSNAGLFGFLGEVLPDYDAERVYPSDIKKLITWYNILWQFAPEIFEESEAETAETAKN